MIKRAAVKAPERRRRSLSSAVRRERPIYTGPGEESIFVGPPADVVAESGGGRSDSVLNAYAQRASSSLSLKRLSILRERETRSSEDLGSSRELN